MGCRVEMNGPYTGWAWGGVFILNLVWSLGNFFEGKKTFLMESFYHMMRKKHNVLMQGDKPLTGKWNYDGENRKKLPKDHKPTPPLVFNNDVSEIVAEINKTNIKTIGNVDAKNFSSTD